MIAAGVNAKALATYMGHASVTITLDRYGHLMPGNENEAAALLDAYLIRADTQARVAHSTRKEAEARRQLLRRRAAPSTSWKGVVISSGSDRDTLT
ncbi:MAG: hypothetical protein H0V71_12230 [Chloroflexi bacterium]|nr:hypothetical protein [Chloroflexota bacterium]